jgi:WhiB family redox-sensing transcriptional regulator
MTTSLRHLFVTSSEHGHPGADGRLLLDVPDLPGALCAETDPEAFFPEKGGSSRNAKETCMACTVREACLDWALERGERHGIWGGMSERERRTILRRMRRGAVA